MMTELTPSRVANCISECEEEYNKLMLPKLDNLRTAEELTKVHEKAKSTAINHLSRTCSLVDPTLRKKYEEELRETIEDTFEEIIEVFEIKRTNEEYQIKSLLHNVRRSYHNEMGKHFRNCAFITPTQLEELHVLAKDTVVKKCESTTNLSHFQRADLDSALDALLEIYEKKNDMNLQSGEIGVDIAPAIGIYLGTTHCCVAVYYKGKVHIIPNQEQGGIKLTPSYVAFGPDQSTKTYGATARDNSYRDPANTIYDVQRIIGRKMPDLELQNDMQFWPFTVQEDEGVPKVWVHGRLLFPEQISAKLLAQFRVMADRFLNLQPGTIKNAVITAPAYFNDGQRQATVDVGKLARYENILSILNEPTAAAIAYSLERLDTEPKKILVYDLSDRSFDVAVLEMKAKRIEVLAVNGDSHLGGDDFARKTMEYCASCFKNECGIDLFDGKDSNVFIVREAVRSRLRRIQTYCENVVRDLKWARRSQVSVDSIIDGQDLAVKVTREKFEELNMSYFVKSIKLVDETLLDAGLRKEEIDDVILVGGFSTIPKVEDMLRNYFHGKALNCSIDPQFVVAYGAAVQAALLNGKQLSHKPERRRLHEMFRFQNLYQFKESFPTASRNDSQEITEMQNSIKIGREGCSISVIVVTLKNSSSFSLLHEKWTDIARELDIPRVKIKTLRKTLLVEMINLSDVMDELIEDWVGRNGEQATLGEFIKILKLNGLNDCAEALHRKFVGGQSTSQH